MALQFKVLSLLVLVGSSSATTAKQPEEFYSSSYSSYSSSSTTDKDGKMHTVEDRSESSTSKKGDMTKSSTKQVHCVDGKCGEAAAKTDGEKPEDQPSSTEQSRSDAHGFLEKKSGAMAEEQSVADQIRSESARAQSHMESSMRSMEDRMRSMEHGMQQEFAKVFTPIRNLREHFATEHLQPFESNSAPFESNSASQSQSVSEVFDGKNGQFRAVKRVTRCHDKDCITQEMEVAPKEDAQK
eukprot:gnl/MRDRNA2_/MRDRNA2_129485_c0_seq1.p1 gnl/MRDRNA2_/MRDRNA2_129485_c0~~gnl/MRDRNA2_/MRDRNA2_129485_c0_seq1.p1  ORF type:complete len:241 (+),score=62.52 gnl/MRDRNA2_/MRDRNA2_129485_c0_seq1:83-805(+)